MGINAIATWDATTGLAEAARRGISALVDTGEEVSLEDVWNGAPRDPRRLPGQLRALQRGRPYAIDLCFLNINEMKSLPEDFFQRARDRSYVIGSWYWEVEELPIELRHYLSLVNEIWVASEHVKIVFSRYVDIPVTVVPAVVAPSPDPNVGRERFSIPEDRCVFLFTFDANSIFARKNPWGLIEAFRQAFSRVERHESVHLVIKALNLNLHADGDRRLRHELSVVGGQLIDENLSAGEIAGLIGCCDVYISLHRAEGFGLGMAEAMYLGRPVICTNYSGNKDFTTATTSLPVAYELRNIDLGELHYNEGVESILNPEMLWAEPNIAQAAHWMRYLYEHPRYRSTLGARGRTRILNGYSSQTVGAVMRRRLLEIDDLLHVD